jgi:hypothetical protein
MKFDEFQALKAGDRVRVKAAPMTYEHASLPAGDWWTVERRDGITVVTLAEGKANHIFLTLSRCSEWEVEVK